jgi:hypothetical protein
MAFKGILMQMSFCMPLEMPSWERLPTATSGDIFLTLTPNTAVFEHGIVETGCCDGP